MKKIIRSCAFFLLCSMQLNAQDVAVKEITGMLSGQEQQWNAGSLEKFMEPYWKNDSLMFIGKNGVTYGWNKTLANYRRSYPDAAAMGILKFDIIEMKRLSAVYYHVVGKWHLTRNAGDLSGHFTLLIKKIGQNWKIVADHSS